MATRLKASLIKGAGENVFTAFSRAVSENTYQKHKIPQPCDGLGYIVLTG